MALFAYSTFNRGVSNKPLFVLGFLILLLAFPSIAFADGGQSNAIDTILRSDSLEGQDAYRNTISGYLSKPISLIITIAGFLMITLSFLRVVITFLYLTFPDMFDKIDEHQRNARQGGFKDKTPIDMISYVFAIILPNIKALSDYSKDDADMDQTPMDYLKKKMPTILIFVILGAMIFDGQMRSFIAKAADVGMLFGNIFESHDTVGMVAGFIDTGERYDFTYNKTTQTGKNEQKIAKSLQKHIHGLNPNLKSVEHADAVGKYIEDNMSKITDDMLAGAKKGGIANFDDIVNFNFKVSGRETPLRGIDGKEGTGVIQLQISDSKVLDKSKQKYIVIHYSQIVDKDNRNALFKATESVIPGQGNAPSTTTPTTPPSTP